METTTPSEKRHQYPINGSTQLLCETYIELKPPMSTILNETWVAEITDASIYANGVLVTGQLTHTFQYLHPHGQKSNEEQTEDNDKKRYTTTEQIEAFSVLSGNGSGGLVTSNRGIVHFHQQVIDFAGNVAMPDVALEDVITGATLVQTTSAPVFVPTVTEDNGLISGGEVRFKIDISITATTPTIS